MDRPRRSDCTAGQIDGEAGWWTTRGRIGLSPLERVMGVDIQQQHHQSEHPDVANVFENADDSNSEKAWCDGSDSETEILQYQEL